MPSDCSKNSSQRQLDFSEKSLKGSRPPRRRLSRSHKLARCANLALHSSS
jgi:hypothetical protein